MCGAVKIELLIIIYLFMNTVVYMLTGEFNGITVLAKGTVAVATMLAALAVYLCLSRNRRTRNVKDDYEILQYVHTLSV